MDVTYRPSKLRLDTPWLARAKYNNVDVVIGNYGTPEAAADAYDDYAIRKGDPRRSRAFLGTSNE